MRSTRSIPTLTRQVSMHKRENVKIMPERRLGPCAPRLHTYLGILCAILRCLFLLLLLQTRTQPHLGRCMAAATAAASAIFMHLCTNSATPYTSRQHMRSCNDVEGNCANRRSRLTTAVAGPENSRWASLSTGRSCIPKAARRLQPLANHTAP
jgi:hypothetical protein